jgi:Uncharacterized protein conserved in bacteria (DUF2059)
MKALATALLIALTAPGLATAQTASAPAAATGDPARLVGLIVPDQQMSTLIGAGFRTRFATAIAGDPKAKALYEANPGMQDFVGGRVADALAGLIRADLPELRTQLVAIVREEMEPDEIADTIGFFESPTGTKMRARAIAALQQQTPATAEQGQQAAAQAAIADLTPDDYPVLTTFGTSSAAKKMQIVNPKIMAASQAWGQQIVSVNAARLKAVRDVAEAEFLAKAKAK